MSCWRVLVRCLVIRSVVLIVGDIGFGRGKKPGAFSRN